MNARNLPTMETLQAARDELAARCEATGDRAPLDAWQRVHGAALDALQDQERGTLTERDLSAGAAYVLANVRAALDFAEGMAVSEDVDYLALMAFVSAEAAARIGGCLERIAQDGEA